jgi:hypothetical protein
MPNRILSLVGRHLAVVTLAMLSATAQISARSQTAGNGGVRLKPDLRIARFIRR